MTASSAWSWRKSPSTGASPRRPGAGKASASSPANRGKTGRTVALVEGSGITLGRVLAPANRHDFSLLAPTLDKLGEIGPLPGGITVHLDAGYDSQKTRDELTARG